MTHDLDKYNGWTNRATWLVALHLDNTEHLHYAARRASRPDISAARREMRETLGDSVPDRWVQDRARQSAADRLRDFVGDELIGDRFASHDPASLLVSDLLGNALADVDWREIADSFDADAREREAYEDRRRDEVRREERER